MGEHVLAKGVFLNLTRECPAVHCFSIHAQELPPKLLIELHLQMWRVYQRGLERWIADLLQPVFDNLVTDGMVPRFVQASHTTVSPLSRSQQWVVKKV